MAFDLFKRIGDITKIAKARRAELRGDFERAQDMMAAAEFYSNRYKRFSDAYLAKLMVVNYDAEATKFLKSRIQKPDDFLHVTDGSYYLYYLKYLLAVVSGNSSEIAELHGRLSKIVPRGLARGCLPTFPLGSATREPR